MIYKDTKQEALDDAQERVQEHGQDLVVYFDGGKWIVRDYISFVFHSDFEGKHQLIKHKR